MQTQFADTVLNIAITGPLVRLDLGIVTPQTDGQGKQQLRATATQQLVMPIEGFVRAFGMQEQVMKKLLADGVIQAKPAGKADADAAQAPAAADAAPKADAKPAARKR